MKKRVVCYGDSHTWGYIPGLGQRYDEDIRWTGLLQEKLGSDYVVVEEGLSGRTTVWDEPLDPDLNGMACMPAILRSAAPIDLLIFMLGTNDFQMHIPAGNPITTSRAIQTMLEKARKLELDRPNGEKMKILLLSPIEVTEAWLNLNEDRQIIDDSRRLGKYLAVVAKELGVEFMDMAKYLKPSDVDGVHMDETGHAEMAEIIYKKVKEMLP